MIETVQDWNTRLGHCGCCPMPICPAPELVCETFYASIFLERAYDDGDVPDGDFNLDLWKVYRSLRRQTTSTGNSDVENTSTEGSLTTTANEEFSSLYWKFGGFGEFPINTTNYSGDGSFIRRIERNYTCGGVTTKEVASITTWTASHVGDAEQNRWDVEIQNQIFSYICTPPLTLNKTTTSSSAIRGLTSSSVHGIEPASDTKTEITPENPVTWAEWLAGAEAELPAWVASMKSGGFWVPGSCEASYVVSAPTSYPSGPNDFFADYFSSFIGISVTAKPVRFRFKIPSSHLGSYFKITYDIAEFPTDGDAFFVSENNTVEWSGPGSGASSDPSWLTPWTEIEPPEAPGQRRIVNIRYACYHGTKYGTKPQVTGEALVI